MKAEENQRVAFHILCALEGEGKMTFRHSGSLFAEGLRGC